MRILFMGTPEFAVSVLDRILSDGHQVVGVVTTPDRPAGRGQHLKYSDVKKYALENNLFLMQPERLKDDKFVEQIRALQADVFVVVAFRMLPKVVYTMPPKGTFNVHASLLPQYRGAAPIQWAIINGEKKTGVTTFFLDEHTDTGAILLQCEVEITRDDNAGTLHDKLMAAGADIAAETLKEIEQGTITLQPQKDDGTLKPAPKIFKEDMRIDWNDKAENIYNKIRGLSPYPTAFSKLHAASDHNIELLLKIYQCHITDRQSMREPGYISIEEHKKINISTIDFDISIDNLQIEGKKRMKVEQFLAGFRFDNYTNTLD